MKKFLPLMFGLSLSCSDAKFAGNSGVPASGPSAEKEQRSATIDGGEYEPMVETKVITEAEMATSPAGTKETATTVVTATTIGSVSSTTTTAAANPCFSGSATKLAAATITVNQATGAATYLQRTGAFNGTFTTNAGNTATEIKFADNETITILMNATCLRTSLTITLSAMDDSIGIGGIPVDVSIDAAAGNDRIETLNVGNYGGKTLNIRGGLGSDSFVFGGTPGVGSSSILGD